MGAGRVSERGREEGREKERRKGMVHSLGIFPKFRPSFAEENNITEEV